jgi:hypothetical protein
MLSRLSEREGKKRNFRNFKKVKNQYYQSRILGFHGGEYEDGCLLFCRAV